jgi:hypothetical protein
MVRGEMEMEMGCRRRRRRRKGERCSCEITLFLVDRNLLLIVGRWWFNQDLPSLLEVQGERCALLLSTGG